ncbi:metalloproteinase inhibitor 1-like [Oppia nitens]|uniref:metalloproteinase inhibitor 1-like n=1 Tax=Oppia nitens TaxID=1686743 RepID=UPI0023DCDE5E|nr:metalloproteinase inhibitor 1-like [Oppia nitens]
MGLKLLFLSIIILCWLTIDSVGSCSCSWKPNDRHFCDSDFAALVIANNRTVDNDSTVYGIDLWRVYRFRDGVANEALMRRQLWTGTYDSLCGIGLSIGDPYVVTGYLVNGKPRINICGFNKLWNDMTVDEENGFNSEYRKLCPKNSPLILSRIRSNYN